MQLFNGKFFYCNDESKHFQVDCQWVEREVRLARGSLTVIVTIVTGGNIFFITITGGHHKSCHGCGCNRSSTLTTLGEFLTQTIKFVRLNNIIDCFLQKCDSHTFRRSDDRGMADVSRMSKGWQYIIIAQEGNSLSDRPHRAIFGQHVWINWILNYQPINWIFLAVVVGGHLYSSVTNH